MYICTIGIVDFFSEGSLHHHSLDFKLFNDLDLISLSKCRKRVESDEHKIEERNEQEELCKYTSFKVKK